MKEFTKFLESFQSVVNEDFMIFQKTGELVYSSYHDERIMKYVTNHVFNIEKSSNKKITNIRTKEFTYKTDVYKLIWLSDLQDVHYDDPFLNRISFMFDDLNYSITITKNDQLIYRNKYTTEMLGIDEADKDVLPLFSTIIEEDREKMLKAVNSEGSEDVEVRFKNGKHLHFTVGKSIFEYMDNVYKIISASDITGIKNLQNTAIDEKEYLNRTLESISEGIIILDSDNRIKLFNDVSSQLLGYKKEEVLHRLILDVITFTDEHYNTIDITKTEDETIDGFSVKRDGLLRNLFIKSSEIRDTKGVSLGKVIVLTDLSDIKRREEEILYLSYHDVLTGVYNRAFFEEEIKRMNSTRNLPLTIIMGDLNGLKLTNDVFGHHIGDELLRRAADILKQSIRNEDILARWGGDEFIILLPNTPDVLAQNIIDRIKRNFGTSELHISRRGFSPSISVGYGVKRNQETSINSIISIPEKNMYKQKMLSKQSVYSGAITSMKTVLFEKSNETEVHTNRLYDMCLDIAVKFNINLDDQSDLQLFAMLHDIGKIGIDDNILKKASTLTDSEWVEMRRHPEIGYRIAQAIPELKNVATLILHHHERFDGTGYPNGLKGYDIPLMCRILAVVDAYDAMTNDRTYRLALTKEEAIKELKLHSGTQFDPDVVKIFLANIEK